MLENRGSFGENFKFSEALPVYICPKPILNLISSS